MSCAFDPSTIAHLLLTFNLIPFFSCELVIKWSVSALKLSLEGNRWGHLDFQFRPFSVCVPKYLGFSVLVTCKGRFLVYFALSFRFSAKNKIGFSDLPFDAVWCFSGFSSENMRLNDLSRMHAFSKFACGFRHIPLFKISRSSKLTICTKSLFQW